VTEAMKCFVVFVAPPPLHLPLVFAAIRVQMTMGDDADYGFLQGGIPEIDASIGYSVPVSHRHMRSITASLDRARHPLAHNAPSPASDRFLFYLFFL
jgi:hypothetical protein